MCLRSHVLKLSAYGKEKGWWCGMGGIVDTGSSPEGEEGSQEGRWESAGFTPRGPWFCQGPHII